MQSRDLAHDSSNLTRRPREIERLGSRYPIPDRKMNRRQFLIASAAAAAAPATVFGQSFWDFPRTLWIKRATTGEEDRLVYWANGEYNPDGYRRVCHLLRDVKAQQTVEMDSTLLDILRGIQGWFEAAGIYKPIVVNSGYRSPKTNNSTEGAARNSMHLYGKAVDLWLPDVPAEYLARLALYLQGGGVGVYQGKGFVHVDSGRLRAWRG